MDDRITRVLTSTIQDAISGYILWDTKCKDVTGNEKQRFGFICQISSLLVFGNRILGNSRGEILDHCFKDENMKECWFASEKGYKEIIKKELCLGDIVNLED